MRLRRHTLSLPELILIGGTRALLGGGIALLLDKKLKEDQRKAVGWTLFLVGVLSTIPLGFEIFGGRRLSATTPKLIHEGQTAH